MLLLTASGDLVRVVTGASASVQVHASWADNVSGVITPGRTNTAQIGSATTTTVVAGPSSGQRNVRHLNIFNAHVSTSCDVSVTHDDGTTVETMIKATLLPLEALVMGEDGRWVHYDAAGAEYPAVTGMATRQDMEGAADLDVLVSPAVQHYHPGHPKAWVKCGVSGNSAASYNISSVTDTGTGLVAPQIGTDFAVVDWACVATIERSATSLAVTDLKQCNIRSALQAATGVTLECYDGTGVTAVQEDPASWHMVGIGAIV